MHPVSGVLLQMCNECHSITVTCGIIRILLPTGNQLLFDPFTSILITVAFPATD